MLVRLHHIATWFCTLQLTVLAIILSAKFKFATRATEQREYVTITVARPSIRLTLKNELEFITSKCIFTAEFLTIEKCTKSNRSWLMSGDIIFTFNLHVLMSADMSAGKLGDTMYVMLFFTSWSHDAVTAKRDNHSVNLTLFCEHQNIHAKYTYTHNTRRIPKHIDLWMSHLCDDNRTHSYKHRNDDRPLSCIRLRSARERNSELNILREKHETKFQLFNLSNCNSNSMSETHSLHRIECNEPFPCRKLVFWL